MVNQDYHVKSFEQKWFLVAISWLKMPEAILDAVYTCSDTRLTTKIRWSDKDSNNMIQWHQFWKWISLSSFFSTTVCHFFFFFRLICNCIWLKKCLSSRYMSHSIYFIVDSTASHKMIPHLMVCTCTMHIEA